MKVSLYVLLLVGSFAGVQNHFAQTKRKQIAPQKFVCLPGDIKAETIVDAKLIKSSPGNGIAKETVSQRLVKMDARCKGGKLRDRKGREIRFYRLQNCWGNPPADYLELLETERRTLQSLKKKFTVIEITCNPSGLPPS